MKEQFKSSLLEHIKLKWTIKYGIVGEPEDENKTFQVDIKL